MYLNLDLLKKEQLLQKYDQKGSNKTFIGQVEQFIPDDDESLNIKQTKPSIVIPSIAGFFTDSAIDYKEVQQKCLPRFSIYSGFSALELSISQEEPIDWKIKSSIAWCILVYQTINNAILPAWIMTVAFDKYLRIFWRFFIQTLFFIPLILHEQRSGNDEIKKQYQLSYILKVQNLRKLYLASLIPSLSLSIFLFCFEYTYITNVFLLGYQTNFWLSIMRTKTENHHIEKVGQFLWIIGLMILVVSLNCVEYLTIPHFAQQFINKFIYTKQPIYRILIGTTLPLLSSFLSAKLSRYNLEAREIFPMHLTNFAIALFTCFNVLIAGFFVDGIYFNDNKQYGLFGLFSDGRIITFMYISIIIISGNYLCSILTSKLFDQLTLVTFNLVEPILTSILLKCTGVQYYPESLTYIGYTFLQGGQLIIIVGQKILGKHY